MWERESVRWRREWERDSQHWIVEMVHVACFVLQRVLFAFVRLPNTHIHAIVSQSTGGKNGSINARTHTHTDRSSREQHLLLGLSLKACAIVSSVFFHSISFIWCYESAVVRACVCDGPLARERPPSNVFNGPLLLNWEHSFRFVRHFGHARIIWAHRVVVQNRQVKIISIHKRRVYIPHSQ